MSDASQRELRNKLLQRLAPEHYRLLVRRGLEAVEMDHEALLKSPPADSRFVYFPESGIVSITARTRRHEVEVAMIGREGMVGVSTVLGAQNSPEDIVVRVPGRWSRITSKALLVAMDEAPAMRSVLLLYVQAYLKQVSHAVITTARFSVEVRLARWLLMCHDRADTNELAVTHQTIASVLGVRRPGVTVATHVLEGEGIILARRGRIVVLSRAKLEAFAGESYGQPEAEYDRLFTSGWLTFPFGTTTLPGALEQGRPTLVPMEQAVGNSVAGVSG